MKIVRTIAEVRAARLGSVGFVPTMGAFHQGHLDLMRRAREASDQVIVSLFVNPTQFGKGEDFERYPRDLERDAAMAEEVGVDLLFAPSVEEIYPRTPSLIHVPEVTDRWEGAARPGHFDGVATVVAKLFNIVQPNAAYFGQKDLQQCLVIRRMVEDLAFPVQLRFIATTRESDGLALSSRNVYLSQEERAVAPILHLELDRCRQMLRTNGIEAKDVEGMLNESRVKLSAKGFAVDYFEYVSLDTLAPIREATEESALIVAAKIGRTRLIDNVVLRDFILDEPV